MRIKMLETVSSHVKGSVVPVEDVDAKRYIAAGFAEEAPAENPLTNLGELIADGLAKGLAKFETAKATDPKHPAYAGPVATESAIDKQKCLADQVKWITVAQCPHVFPGRQTEAHEHLEKVYGSSLRQFEKKDLAEGSGATGGYTVAPDYGKELLMLAAEKSVVEPYSNKKTLPAREAYYPMLNQTSVPTAGTTAFYGGVAMSWSGEAQPGTPTEPNFKQVHIVTNELQGLTKISRFLLSDSFLALDAELKSLYSGAISWFKDSAYLNGNGVAKPKGVLQSAATIVMPRTTSLLFKLADAANMMGAILPSCRPNAVWVMNNSLFSQLVQLVDASGRVVYIPNVGTGYNEAKLTGQLLLFGRPVLFTEKLPAVGSTGDVLLADFSKYITADTGTLEIAASDQYAFNTNQITYRIIARVDGQAQIDGPVTLSDGSTKNSAFVALKDATS